VQPVLEARLAESGVIVRNQCPLAHRDTEVARVRVGDYLARIRARSQVPSDEFVQAKLFGAPYFNGAIPSVPGFTNALGRAIGRRE
jgi:hypothetical protein